MISWLIAGEVNFALQSWVYTWQHTHKLSHEMVWRLCVCATTSRDLLYLLIKGKVINCGQCTPRLKQFNYFVWFLFLCILLYVVFFLLMFQAIVFFHQHQVTSYNFLDEQFDSIAVVDVIECHRFQHGDNVGNLYVDCWRCWKNGPLKILT